MALTVARQLVVMAIIVVVSFFFSRKNNFGQKESQFLSRVLLYAVNPCMIFTSFNVEFSAERLKSLGLAILIAFVFHLVMMVAVTIFVRKNNDDFGKSDIGKIGVVFTNSGFIGIPLIKGVFGDEGVFYLVAYLLNFNVLLWTWGEYLLSRKFAFKKIITNPNVIAVILGFAFFCLPIKLPYVIMEPLRMIGAVNGTVAMMLLGLLFAVRRNAAAPQQGVGRGYKKTLAFHSILRLVICPLAILAFAFAALKIFGSVQNINLIISVLFVAAACPAGMSVSSMAVVYNKDATYASYLVLLTSAACVVTIPLLVLLMQVVCGI